MTMKSSCSSSTSASSAASTSRATESSGCATRSFKMKRLWPRMVFTHSTSWWRTSLHVRCPTSIFDVHPTIAHCSFRVLWARQSRSRLLRSGSLQLCNPQQGHPIVTPSMTTTNTIRSASYIFVSLTVHGNQFVILTVAICIVVDPCAFSTVVSHLWLSIDLDMSIAHLHSGTVSVLAHVSVWHCQSHIAPSTILQQAEDEKTVPYVVRGDLRLELPTRGWLVTFIKRYVVEPGTVCCRCPLKLDQNCRHDRKRQLTMKRA